MLQAIAPQHRLSCSHRSFLPQICPSGRRSSVARSFQCVDGQVSTECSTSIFHRLPCKWHTLSQRRSVHSCSRGKILGHQEIQRTCTSSILVSPSGDGDKDQPTDFAKKLDQVWGIRKQPQPVACETCGAEGGVECPWCKGTGFFILGDNMLCEVPSRNTSCRICQGAGTTICEDCKGTGFRAKWMGLPQKKPQYDGPIDPLF